MNCSIRSLAHDGMASFEYQGHSQLVGCGILRWPTSFQMASLSLSLSLSLFLDHKGMATRLLLWCAWTFFLRFFQTKEGPCVGEAGTGQGLLG